MVRVGRMAMQRERLGSREESTTTGDDCPKQGMPSREDTSYYFSRRVSPKATG